MKYEKTQYGWLAIALLLITIVSMFFLYMEQWGTHPIPKAPFLIMEGLFVFILSLFYKMTTSIEEGVVRMIYGIGLIRIKIKPERISSVEVFKVPWYWGVGIRITPKGWLYSINGFRAVKIEYKKNGFNKTNLIGSSEPEELKSALEYHFS